VQAVQALVLGIFSLLNFTLNVTQRHLTVDEFALVGRQQRLLRLRRGWRGSHQTASGRKVSQVACLVVGAAVDHRRVNERRQRVQLLALSHVVEEHRRRSTESNEHVIMQMQLALNNRRRTTFNDQQSVEYIVCYDVLVASQSYDDFRCYCCILSSLKNSAAQRLTEILQRG